MRWSTHQAPLDAVTDADALVIVTEWGDFRRPDFKALKAAMANHVIFDGRNLFDSAEMLSHGFLYHSIGRRVVDGRPKEVGSGLIAVSRLPALYRGLW